jgi:hypothetical protein
MAYRCVSVIYILIWKIILFVPTMDRGEKENEEETVCCDDRTACFVPAGVGGDGSDCDKPGGKP